VATTVASDTGSDGNFYCIHGGSIGGTTGSCSCVCQVGYSGDSCEIANACVAAVDLSSHNGGHGRWYCLNGGRVAGTTGSCSCICPAGYTGPSCETPSRCVASEYPGDVGMDGHFYCINGGNVGGTTGSCICTNCPDDYSGQNCEMFHEESSVLPWVLLVFMMLVMAGAGFCYYYRVILPRKRLNVVGKQEVEFDTEQTAENNPLAGVDTRTPEEKLRMELAQVKLIELHQRAYAEGIAHEKADAAMEDFHPKEGLIKLIIEHRFPKQDDAAGYIGSSAVAGYIAGNTVEDL
jgi:hypothetical protein